MKEQEIFDKAADCRIFLRVHGFLPDRESDRVRERINKYGLRNNVNLLRGKSPAQKKTRDLKD